MRVLLASFLLVAASPSIAQTTTGTVTVPAQMSESEMVQLQQSLDRGYLLWLYDQAAWHSTDALLKDLSKEMRSQIRGWVVTRQPKSEKASYFGVDGSKPFFIYSAIWDGTDITDRTIAEPSKREALSPEAERLASALLAARPIAENFKRCGEERFNTVVIPGRTEVDPIAVYFLTPQTEKDVFPMGGHYRVEVRDGAVVAQRAFTNSCIALSTAAVPDGGKPEALMLTHLLDPVPTEIHVFGVFMSGLPLFVSVPDGRLYSVELDQGRPQARIVPTK